MLNSLRQRMNGHYDFKMWALFAMHRSSGSLLSKIGGSDTVKIRVAGFIGFPSSGECYLREFMMGLDGMEAREGTTAAVSG